LLPAFKKNEQPGWIRNLDMLRPWIDEGHILASTRHIRAGVVADH
jgi:hypothetical protein